MSLGPWSQEQTLLFLELLQTESVIWDPNDTAHKDKRKVHDAWLRIQEIIQIPVEDLKKKKESLFATYRGYYRKIVGSINSGDGVNDVYRPIWFAYDVMDNFLGPVFRCKVTMDTKQNDELYPKVEIHEEELESPDPLETSDVQATKQKKILRRLLNTPELQNATKQISEPFNTLINALNRKSSDEEDECDIFGKLIAKKLKKMPENEREDLMFDIHSLCQRSRRS